MVLSCMKLQNTNKIKFHIIKKKNNEQIGPYNDNMTKRHVLKQLKL